MSESGVGAAGPKPEATTIKIELPKLREMLLDVLRNYRPGGPEMTAWTTPWTALVAEFERRLVSPEPAEPAPGVYRDGYDRIWRSETTGDQADDPLVWLRDGEASEYAWPAVLRALSALTGRVPLTPLYSADELIPDPDDANAVWNLAMDVAPARSPREIELVQGALRVLRARAEARQTEGGDRV